jgi:hypothetical protein
MIDKKPEGVASICSFPRGGRLAFFPALCADVELTSNLVPVAKWHYTNCSRNSRPTILAAR